MGQLKFIKLLVIFVAAVSMTGCWDQKELDQKAYVIGIGLDTYDAEGKVKITYLIANPEVGSQQSSGGTNEPPQEMVSFIADDFIASRNTANAVVAKEISYDLLQVIIVSEKLAKKRDFIRWIYSAAKDREIKRSAQLVVSKEAAEEFIVNNKPKLETRPHKYFELMIDRGQETGMIPNADLNGFFQIAESDSDLFLAIYASAEKSDSTRKMTDDDIMAGDIQIDGTTNEAQFMGSAVFMEGKMIGEITGEETRISSLLDSSWETEDVLTTFKDPFDDRFRISARVSQKQENTYKLKRKSKNSRPEIEIKVPLFIEVLSDPSMTNYANNKGKVEELKQSLTAAIETNMAAYIARTQEEFKGETFHLSVPIRKEFSTHREFRDFDWMKSYPNAKVKVRVVVQFGEFGRQTKLPNMHELRD
jgi:spore germination protein KC